MKTVCITLGGAREARARQHFAAAGLGDVGFFRGLDADRLGLRSVLPYEVDAPGSGYVMGPKPTGVWISHRAIWSALLLGSDGSDDEEILILEDDARFPQGWRERFDRARADVPEDWDVLFAASCCAAGKPTKHVRGEVHEVRWPMCLHAYLVRRRALQAMIDTQDAARCYGPVDITLVFHTWPSMRVYTVLPRIADQWDTGLGD